MALVIHAGEKKYNDRANLVPRLGSGASESNVTNTQSAGLVPAVQ